MSISEGIDTKTLEAQGWLVPPLPGDGFWSAMVAGRDDSVYMVVSSMSQKPCRLVRIKAGSEKIEEIGIIQEICGESDPDLVPQTKVHAQLVEDSRGRIWFGTDSDDLYPADAHDWSARTGKYPKGYTGGHLVCYDPVTGRFKDHGILFPKQKEYPGDITECGLYFMSMTSDPRRDVLYFLTGNRILLGAYDMAAERLIDSQPMPIAYPLAPDPARNGCTGFYHCRDMRVAADGWMYTFSREGQVIRYSDREKRIEMTGVWIPGVDKIQPNMPYALAVNRERTRIYGNASGTGRLFELVVEPGSAPQMHDLGDPFVPGHEGEKVIHAITTGLDGNIYFMSTRGPWFYGYDPVERRVTAYGEVTLMNLGGLKPAWSTAGVTDLSGTLWFGGGFPVEKHMFMAITPDKLIPEGHERSIAEKRFTSRGSRDIS